MTRSSPQVIENVDKWFSKAAKNGWDDSWAYSCQSLFVSLLTLSMRQLHAIPDNNELMAFLWNLSSQSINLTARIVRIVTMQKCDPWQQSTRQVGKLAMSRASISPRTFILPCTPQNIYFSSNASLKILISSWLAHFSETLACCPLLLYHLPSSSYRTPGFDRDGLFSGWATQYYGFGVLLFY